MSAGDYIAIGVLGLFALLGVMGSLRWLIQAAIGVAVGCLVLIALSRAQSVPALGRVGALLNDGHITPSLTRQMDIVADNLRSGPPPDVDSQEPGTDDTDSTDADTDGETGGQAAAHGPAVSGEVRTRFTEW